MGVIDSIIKQITGADGALGTILDKVVTNKGEIAEAKRLMAETLLQNQVAYESELTKRHEADSTSKSWLSRNIRAGSLVVSFLFLVVFAFMEWYTKEAVNPVYVDSMNGTIKLATSFYFGSHLVKHLAHTQLFENITKKK